MNTILGLVIFSTIIVLGFAYHKRQKHADPKPGSGGSLKPRDQTTPNPKE